MFRSATVQLTILYVAILAVICLFFNVSLYQFAAGELHSRLSNQAIYYRELPGVGELFGDHDAASLVQAQDSAGRRHIILELIYADIFLLALGGFGSYYLARRTLQPIEEAHDAQRRFTADASHELRTPIAAMRTEIEVALRDPGLSPSAAKKLLSSNLEELAKLTNLSENLLQLARGETVAKVEATVNLAEVVRAATEQTSSLAKAKKIIVTNRSEANLLVRGDSETLTQALVVLLDNAIKYSSTGRRVTVRLKKVDRLATVTVQDQGIGIKSSEVPRLFERFYRTDQARHKPTVGGYGLGLAIAKQIIDAHHGQITAKSRLGHGSTFTLTLPRQSS